MRKFTLKAVTPGKLWRPHLCLFIQGQMLGLKLTRKKGKPKQNQRAAPGVSGAGFLEQVWRAQVSSGRGRLCQHVPVIRFCWKRDQADGPQSLALLEMRGWVGLALLWALTTRRCSCVLGSRTSRCRWGGTACLSAPVFHPETQPHRVRHVAL